MKRGIKLESLSSDNFMYFLLLFMPGFIFIKSSNLFVATGENDFSKNWYDAVAYGIIFSGLTYIAYQLLNKYIPLHFFLVVGMIILPSISPMIIKWFRDKPCFYKHMLRLEVSAWDYVFSSRQSYWVILHLKDGRDVAGVYSNKSFTSAFPYAKDIYLEELWTLDENKKFLAPVPRSAGLWIIADEISSVEFFYYEEDTNEQ